MKRSILDAIPSASDLTFGVIGKAAMDDCEPVVVAAYEAALERLRKAGVKLVDVEPGRMAGGVGAGPNAFSL